MKNSETRSMLAAMLRMAVAMAGWLAVGAVVQPLTASAAGTETQAAATPARKTSPYRPEGLTRGARNYYAAMSGVDDLKVRRTNAGNLIRFSYRVTNAELAKPLVDKQATPYLIGHTSRAVLNVPVMDKVGQLRQSTAQEVGKELWMVFSNKGDLVKTGERVSVVIGRFHVDGLVVE